MHGRKTYGMQHPLDGGAPVLRRPVDWAIGDEALHTWAGQLDMKLGPESAETQAPDGLGEAMITGALANAPQVDQSLQPQ